MSGALTSAPGAQTMAKEEEEPPPAMKAKMAAINALIDLATADKDKYPPGKQQAGADAESRNALRRF